MTVANILCKLNIILSIFCLLILCYVKLNIILILYQLIEVPYTIYSSDILFGFLNAYMFDVCFTVASSNERELRLSQASVNVIDVWGHDHVLHISTEMINT